MILGLLSDTHGSVERTRTAMNLLLGAHAERIVHCGDVGSDDVLYAIASAIEGKDIQVQAVFGNVDEWDHSLKNFPLGLGISLKQEQSGEAEGKTYAVIHGHDWKRLEQLCASPDLNYVFTGHTHEQADKMSGTVRVINPGAVYRASVPSVAVLNTDTDELTVLPI